MICSLLCYGFFVFDGAMVKYHSRSPSNSLQFIRHELLKIWKSPTYFKSFAAALIRPFSHQFCQSFLWAFLSTFSQPFFFLPRKKCWEKSAAITSWDRSRSQDGYSEHFMGTYLVHSHSKSTTVPIVSHMSNSQYLPVSTTSWGSTVHYSRVELLVPVVL